VDHNTPDFRATLRPRGPVRLVEWGPWLAAGGPLHTLLDARAQAGIAIADFTVIRDSDGTARELIIEFLAGDSPQHRATISTWAAGVGYSRVWFPGDVADLDPVPGGPAETRCTGCRVRLVDSDASFWEFVRHHGAFPATCVLCGSDLPQWRPVRPVCLDETEGSPVAGRSGRAV
jgi:hypothetical protein